MNRSVQLCFILIALFWLPSTGQKISKECATNYALSYFRDTKSWVSKPFKWNKKQSVVAAGILGVGASLFLLDEKINAEFSGVDPSDYRSIKYGLFYFGNGYYTMPLMAGMFVYGLSAKKTLPFQTSLMGVKSFVLATVVARVLKYPFNRYRPEEGVGANFWGGPLNDFSLSFPSGHTTGAFAVATVLARQYSHVKWVPVLSYSIATAVGLSRIKTNEHWASDVFFGGLIGWSIGTVVSKIDCAGKKSEDKSGMKISGNGLVYRF